MSEQTNFTEVTAEKFTGNFVGDVTGSLIVTLSAIAEISKPDSYAIVAADKVTPIIVSKMTVGSKDLTLGLAANKAVIVYNSGSESYTVKNVAADTGTVLATTKALLVVGSATKDASIVVALN